MRLILSGVMYASLFFLNPWITLVLAIMLSLMWNAWEVVLLGFLFDIVYLPDTIFLHIPFLSTTISLIIIWGLYYVRRQLYIDIV